MKQINFTILLTMFVSMVSTKALAYDVAVKNEDGVTIYYNYINNSTELEVKSGNNGYSGSVRIPDSVTILNKTRKVTSIGSTAFYGNGLISVTIPGSVKNIDQNAFQYCHNLKKIVVKDLAVWCGISFSNKEGNPLYYAQRLYSDEDTEIKDLVIPDGVTSISDFAFIKCFSLTSVTIPSSVTNIGKDAFIDCTGLKKVIVKDLTAWCRIPFSTVYSNPLRYAHHLYNDEDTEITDLVIPNDLTSIGNKAFSYCSGLTSVTIHSNVASISDDAFYNCTGLKKVIVKDLAAWCSISFDSYYSNPLYYAQHLYRDKDTEITDLVIPDNVMNIGNYVFSNCSATSVAISSNVTTIGDLAFFKCESLTSITIPNNVKSIGNSAFWGCDNLAEIVSLIQEPFTVIGIVSDIVYNNGTLYVPLGTIEKYKATNGWKQFVWMEEGVPTGIQPLKDSSNVTETQRYTIGGQSIKNPQRGLNIIKMSDGTTKKVMVK